MKTPKILIIILLPLLLSLCSCISPKPIEIGQKKIPTPPPSSISSRVEADTLYTIYANAEEIYTAGLQLVNSLNTSNILQASNLTLITNKNISLILTNTQNIKLLSLALLSTKDISSFSKKDPTYLVSQIQKEEQKRENQWKNIVTFLDKYEGLKVENTGIIKINYFLYLFGIVILIVSIGVILQVIFKLSTSPWIYAVKEIVQGIEIFKRSIQSQIADSQLQQEILKLLKEALRSTQSKETEEKVFQFRK